ncbi:uncharacterized protein ELE39_002580 [Cryptosporidium sp. chipmunk genotype I]|uniref:uncharacterized protein n=1 Tax=Cryptosporidium sp. chipmunk genotype I TaxID=1280935 RepID=UPI00351A1635|nr:hypothetical protein ELE39_002580 [Cryptosporidium sp. chipmunk genotype I]
MDMLPKETDYFINNENNFGSIINDSSGTEQTVNINDNIFVESKSLDRVESKQRFKSKFSINTQKEPSIDRFLSSDQAYLKNQSEFERTSFACNKPEPSSISSISKEMKRLCSILTALFDSKDSIYLEFTEEQFRWHWINILKCTSIEEFSPYQVILAPLETGYLSSKTIENVIYDLKAFYKLHEKESNDLRSVSKKGSGKKNDTATSVKIDQALVNINDCMKQEGLKKKDEIYKKSKRSTYDCSKKKLSKPGRKSTSKENAARILRMCLASSISETSKAKGSINENITDGFANKSSDKHELNDQQSNEEVESDMFQMGFECGIKPNMSGQDRIIESKIGDPGHPSLLYNEASGTLN